MVSPGTNIMNWKNGILLSAVSYALYLIIWLLLDDETSKQLPAMIWSDYLFDFSLCVLFTYISLGFCYLLFKFLPFRTSYLWTIIYASGLLIINNVVAFGMVSLFCLIWGDIDSNAVYNELINMKGAYQWFGKKAMRQLQYMLRQAFLAAEFASFLDGHLLCRVFSMRKRCRKLLF